MLVPKDIVVLANDEPTSNGTEKTTHSTNLRHNNNNNGSRTQFHRHAAESKEENNINDCSIEMSRDGMPPADVKRSSVAAKLSFLVYDLDDAPAVANELFDGQDFRGVLYESGIDAVYTARIGNEFCVAAFRGTKMKQDDGMKDIESNSDIDPIEFEMGDTSKKEKKGGIDAALCDTHSGFHSSYFDFDYRLSVEDFLETCREECPECDVVLTGHSQGGGIAEIAALQYKKSMNSTPDNLYVITFGAPQALGAGCLPLFANEERCRIFRYAMTAEGPWGRGLIYDPIPMICPRGLGDFDNDGVIDPTLSSDSYARYGGLAFLGHELFLYAGNPSALTLGPFDGHYIVGTSKYDLSFGSHGIRLYMSILDGQIQSLYTENNDECYLPTNGFSLGSLCNKDESDFHCVEGFSECKRNGWFWGSENTCQAIGGSSSSVNTHPLCQKRPLQWTMVP